MTEGEQGKFVWEVELSLQYAALKTTLLQAAEDCDKRGHPKNIGQRYRDAADVCDTAGEAP